MANPTFSVLAPFKGSRDRTNYEHGPAVQEAIRLQARLLRAGAVLLPPLTEVANAAGIWPPHLFRAANGYDGPSRDAGTKLLTAATGLEVTRVDGYIGVPSQNTADATVIAEGIVAAYKPDTALAIANLILKRLA